MALTLTVCPSSRQLACLALALTLTLSSTATPIRGKRHLFISCSGWGAGCSMHSPMDHEFVPVVTSVKAPQRKATPTPVRADRNRGDHGGIPSLVTSGSWEPGTMGKRKTATRDYTRELLDILTNGQRDVNTFI